MAGHDTQQPVPIERARQAAIDTLTQNFARDAIAVDELESRLDAVYSARSIEQIRAVTADLPALRETAAVGHAEARSARVIPASDVPARTTQIAIMSGSERKGAWVPGRRHYTYVMMGGAGLDFREARLGPGVTEVTVMIAMGGAEIVVPPDLAVQTSGFALMGGVDSVDQAPPPDDPMAPVLKIHAFALMGGVEVSVRLPGETARDAKRRRRLERKRRRLGRGRGDEITP